MSPEKLAFVGGTGPEGLGLAVRFAAAGHAIVIGSRSAGAGAGGGGDGEGEGARRPRWRAG